jgi:heme-degrading monooxygenase HmoA
MPGLIEKLWLKQPDTNTFGGVYLWEDQAAATRYRNSELFQQQRAEGEQQRERAHEHHPACKSHRCHTFHLVFSFHLVKVCIGVQ